MGGVPRANPALNFKAMRAEPQTWRYLWTKSRQVGRGRGASEWYMPCFHPQLPPLPKAKRRHNPLPLIILPPSSSPPRTLQPNAWCLRKPRDSQSNQADLTWQAKPPAGSSGMFFFFFLQSIPTKQFCFHYGKKNFFEQTLKNSRQIVLSNCYWFLGHQLFKRWLSVLSFGSQKGYLFKFLSLII